MTAYHSIFEVIKQWFRGADFSKYDTYRGIQFLWLSRSGQLLQFFASLTIIAEIIGKERIDTYRRRFDLLIDLKGFFSKIFWRQWLGRYDSRATPFYTSFLNKLIKTKENIQKPIITRLILFKYRRELFVWLALEENENYRLYRSKFKRNYAREKIIDRRIGLSLLSIWFISTVYGIMDHRGMNMAEVSISAVFFFMALYVTLKPGISNYFRWLYDLIRFILLLPIEIFIIFPILAYLTLSKREQIFKLISLILFLIGFSFSLIFS